MKKTNFKEIYVVLDLTSLNVRLCSSKQRLADILGIHRNSVKIGKEPVLRGNKRVIKVTEE